MYSYLLKPLLFLFSPETAHRLAFSCLRFLMALPFARRVARALLAPTASGLKVQALGRTFDSPVLLAAGFDKNAEGYESLGALGFAGVEVGTITFHEQPGNPRPRLFRLPLDRALVNRMGFNNDGAAALAQRLSTAPALPVPLGISLGKSKVTPLEAAVDDYLASFRLLKPYGDYFAVNVSSPNTPGLRSLQDRGHLTELVGALRAEAGTTPMNDATYRVRE